MKLHFKEFGEGQPLVILHGLFGSSDNWQTLGKKLSEHFHVHLVDQRNHGHSPKSDDFSYDLMADDLDEMLTDQNLNNIILIGHSMGGKTAMRYAQQDDSRISKLIVVDIGPKQYPLHHQTILEGLASLDLQIYNTRGKCDKKLAEYIPEIGVRQFLLKNLYWVKKGKLGWRINIPILSEKIGVIIDGLPSDKVNIKTLFIRGKKSNYILNEDYSSILDQFPNSVIESFENVGHWVHAEAPEKLYQTLIDFSE